MERHYEITPKTIVFSFALILGVWILYQIRLVVVALFIALILSLALDPLVSRLKSWGKMNAILFGLKGKWLILL